MSSPRASAACASTQPACEPITCNNCGIYQLCLPLGLNQTDLSLLDSIVKRKEVYKRGQVLFRPGERFDYLYAIRSGSVKTYVSTDDGRVQITGFHIAGELLGLSALASRQYSSEAKALETISVCKVEISRLDEIAQQIPSIHYQMLRIMSGQIRHDEELMLLLGKRSAEERLAEYLVGLSRRFASRNYSGTEFRLSMSRLDIGNYLGIAEETVCRILGRFQEDGLITADRRQVCLKDIKRLGALAHVAVAA
ncbi:fumarate/nitrate reduction transcriptional regulator Fnr [Sulfuritalea sp.]|uniref:fumarate/nitrate reduction transcriptional regulator Fnr n=1 Tax=Sulfuritalea sp. TaxID=2480090 RepID=UPI00286E7C5D|nr:fumarate/nitrate reduction transcriptional regulator Fnr [Sulfuritalea sp.]